MESFSKNRIDNLSDVFCAWIGGIPENDNEIKYFLSKHEDVAELLHHRDIEHIVHFHGYFPPETLKAVYSLIPPQVKLANGKKFAVFEQDFEKMNTAESKRINARIVNVDMKTAYNVYINKYADKYMFMKANLKKFRSSNQRVLNPDQQKEWYKQRQLKMGEEEKELKREKAREYRRKWRAEHPENAAIEAAKQRERRKNRSELQILSDKITSRKANRKYRKNNREQIRLRRKNDRLRLKEENPELLKELDKKSNSSPKRAEICHNYYQKHKDEINRKAKENPMVQVYKNRYQIKKRWQEKTGVKVMSLLQAIISAKQRAE